jgi:predicted transcriptional regulator
MGDESDLHGTIRTVMKRAEMLDRLAREPTSKRDLRDDLDVSRSTVYKTVRELEEYELVAQDGNEVRLSLFGQLVFENYRSFVETTDDVDRQQALLSDLPAGAPVTTDLLVGADCVRAEPFAPDRPLNHIEDRIREAEYVGGFAPIAVRRYVELFHEQLTDGGLTAEVVFEESVVNHLWTDYGERFRQSVETDRYSLWTTDRSLPFGLVLAEGDREEVVVVVYDEGKPVGAIANDTPGALDWGRAVFEQYKEEATQVDGDAS